MKMRLITAIALMLVATVVSGCGVAVPDVKGKTPEQATATLVAAGFKAGRVDYDAASTGATGAVVAQDPGAGQSVTAGAVVNLTVAGAAPTTEPPAVTPEQVTVSAVEGVDHAAARDALENAGFVVSEELKEDTADAGHVITQSPAGGTSAVKGSTVTLIVSSGPPAPVKVKVPSVKGLKLSAAKSKLETAGLKYKHVLGAGDGMTDVGFAYKQSPVAGTSVVKGTTVTVYSWSGP
jgi:beta-lactam-binding protein with PASTA domain